MTGEFVIRRMIHPVSVSLQQLVPLFSLSNLDEIGNPRSVLESAHQDDSKTPPGSQNWPRFDGVIDCQKNLVYF